MALLITLIIVSLIFLYLAVIIFLPILSIEPQIMEKKTKVRNVPSCRQDITITLDGTAISAWLYLPEDRSKPVPCVILSHGFGGTKDLLLEKYALRFVESGYAAIAYDYRYFGESGGEPRQLFLGIKQQEDLTAVINYARNQPGIDVEKIILWGTSAAGSYGINTASEDKNIAGVISQCPSLDHKKDDKFILEREGFGFFLKLIVHAQRDKGRSRFGLPAHCIPIVGKSGTLAMLNAPGAFEGYAGITAESEYFQNRVCARCLLMLPGPDPIKTSENVQCPVLILVCENDTIVSPDSYKRVAEILGEKVTVIKYPIGHFDIYEGEHFELAVAAQLEFIKGL